MFADLMAIDKTDHLAGVYCDTKILQFSLGRILVLHVKEGTYRDNTST